MRTTVSISGRDIRVTLCDYCGREPDTILPLYRSVETRLYRGRGEYHPRLTNQLYRTENGLPQGPTEATLFNFHLDEDHAALEQVRDTTPVVELCERCHDELFGWPDDDE